ncbi:MAG: DUF190 domain-containing protein [Actinomycetota bacterium]
MKLEGKGKLVRIYIGESDKWKHKPLYEEIVQAARKMHMAGATVLRGIEGFGAHSHLHTARILRLSEDLPLVIELVDTAEKIDGFLDEIDHMIEEGMVTTERVEIRKYVAGKDPDS